MKNAEFLGIDIGASGVKGAIVDVRAGVLVTERFRIPTPQPSTPKNVATAFNEIVRYFGWEGKTIGCGFPSVIKNGLAQTAANIDDEWLGINIAETFSEYCGCPVVVSNDADIAGIAELQFGVGKNVNGTVLIITIGSGLGSALFRDGILVPNTELGHIYLKGDYNIAEHYAADSARKKQNLSWEEWGARFNEYLHHIELIIAPDLIILGGGGSKKFDKFKDQIIIKTPVIPAVLLNNAGIIGAAIHAFNKEKMVGSASKTIG